MDPNTEKELCKVWRDERYANMDKRIDLEVKNIITRLDATANNLVVARAELERRLEGLNQLREEVVRDRDQFLRSDVYNAKINGVDTFISDNIKRITTLEVGRLDLERRIEGLNELRKQVVEDRGQFLRVEYYDLNHKQIENLINALQTRITVIETRYLTWTVAMGVFFVICQIALHFWSLVSPVIK